MAVMSSIAVSGVTNATRNVPARQVRQPRLPIRRNLITRAEKKVVGETQGVKILDQGQEDSFTRIEQPVRPGAPGDGGPKMSERLEDRDQLFIQDGAKEKELLGTEIALSDAMRFKGAGPEIINGRLSMVAVIAAVAAELVTGKTIVEQFQLAPVPIIGISSLFVVATLIPILKGVPRKDAAEFGGIKFFTSKAELINGRLAIIGFPCLLIQELINMAPTFGPGHAM